MAEIGEKPALAMRYFGAATYRLRHTRARLFLPTHDSNRMSDRRLIVIFAVLVSGCSTSTCRPERILELTPQGKSSFNISSRDANAEDLFLFDERTSVWLKPCDSGLSPNRGALCATIFVPPKHVASLTSSEIRFVLEDNLSTTIHIPQVTFLAQCSSPSLDSPLCTPDARGVTAPATRKVLRRYDYEGRWWTLYEMGVDALTELPGGQYSGFSLGLLLAYQPYRLKALHYTFPVMEDGRAGTLFLPSLNVDGTRVALPPVKVRPTVANVCTRVPV
jgi:hypothetical protein